MSEPVSPSADDVLLASGDLARAALLEITAANTIGAPAGHVVEDERVLSLLFECTMPGYPGWHWSATLARVDESAQPTVLEVELTPGDDALLAPDWVPWSKRMAEHEAAGEDEDDEDLDEDDIDDTEDDIDGVDIDQLATLDEDVDQTDESEGQGDEDDFEGDGRSLGKQHRSEQPQHDQGE